MKKDLYSNIDFNQLRERLNREILRRGTYKWWDPLTTPSVGQDQSSPLSLPEIGEQVSVDEKTYTINNPSTGSIEETRNIHYPAHGVNPSGKEIPKEDILQQTYPDSSASQINVDEFRNFIVGLSKIQDVNLFYGRDELEYLVYRDPSGIEEALQKAEASELNAPLYESDLSPKKNDPNNGIQDRLNPDYPSQYEISYPFEDGRYYMPSGEYDGEELLQNGLSKENFYDDYGAKPGDSNFHPYNRFVSEQTHRDWNDQGNYRDQQPIPIIQGGLHSVRFGTNPRNPDQGNLYKDRPVYGGKKGSCNSACVGLCFQTCDNECGENCMTTCFNRCGEACTANCGQSCTSCSSQCYQSCKTKCENSVGYSCVESGAKTVRIISTGGTHGTYAKNKISYTLHTCEGCSFSCQFYPNKKTECWDSGCMGNCFISCDIGCSNSCYGGCIDNEKQPGTNYKTGKGRGCKDGCTLNCIGKCDGVCEAYCIQTCYQACKQQCWDNCSSDCKTDCGSGCFNRCNNACTGCASCAGTCEGKAYQRGCIGCGTKGGCVSTCQHACNKNCVGKGCRSVCGVDSAGACEANCRLNCTGTSCTAMCSNACSSECNTCVNSCGFFCGVCTSRCSADCGAECNIYCSKRCANNCEYNCTQSCSESCGGCSDLCYSCIGMCIGICSVKCQVTCTSCSNLCSWWCDQTCNRACFSNCQEYCIKDCTGSCATFLESNTTFTKGPQRPPTSVGYIYPNPSNRWEERESFKLTRGDIPDRPVSEERNYRVLIYVNKENNLSIDGPEELKYVFKQTTIHGGVYTYDDTTGNIVINPDMLNEIVEVNQPNINDGGGIFIIIFTYDPKLQLETNEIQSKLPFGFELLDPIVDGESNIICIIQRDPFLFPEEE